MTEPKIKTPVFTPVAAKQLTEAQLTKDSKLLLIGIYYSEPRLRPGFTGMEHGTTHETEVLACRFYDLTQDGVVLIPREHLKGIGERYKLMNTRIKTSRPFTITMTDGGNVAELPVISSSGLIITRNNIIVHPLKVNEEYIITDGNGAHMYVDHTSLKLLRNDPRLHFYNF